MSTTSGQSRILPHAMQEMSSKSSTICVNCCAWRSITLARALGNYKLPPEIALQTFGRESFVRLTDTTGAVVPEGDLFAGLR